MNNSSGSTVSRRDSRLEKKSNDAAAKRRIARKREKRAEETYQMALSSKAAIDNLTTQLGGLLTVLWTMQRAHFETVDKTSAKLESVRGHITTLYDIFTENHATKPGLREEIDQIRQVAEKGLTKMGKKLKKIQEQIDDLYDDSGSDYSSTSGDSDRENEHQKTEHQKTEHQKTQSIFPNKPSIPINKSLPIPPSNKPYWTTSATFQEENATKELIRRLERAAQQQISTNKRIKKEIENIGLIAIK